VFVGSIVVLPVLVLALLGPVIAGAYLAVRLNRRGS
jgi:hypothetical protein